MTEHHIIVKTKETINNYALCNKNEDYILIGVSGGVDSMVLTHILKSLEYKIAIAHCNFKLRGKESDDDALFVEEYAHKHDIPFFLHTSSAQEYAEKHKISVEMAARDIRYDFFHALCSEEAFTKIAIAHNADDSLETFFINFFRTTGLKGLCGIAIQNESVIRPLSHITRKEIEAFAHTNTIRYRTDSTNSEDMYLRNKIRNQLLPLCKTILPQSIANMQTSMKILEDSYTLYKKTVDKEILKLTSIHKNTRVIEKEELLQHPHAHTILFEILHPYGFHPDVITQLFDSLSKQSGKTFSCKNYTAVLDRDYIFIEEHKKQELLHFEIPEFDIEFICETPYGTFTFSKNPSPSSSAHNTTITEYFDADKLTFPLTIRSKKDGDSFQPLGLDGKKKVSDFLIDHKIPIHKKHEVLVLESQETIMWVVPLRISQKGALTKNTQNKIAVSFTKD